MSRVILVLVVLHHPLFPERSLLAQLCCSDCLAPESCIARAPDLAFVFVTSSSTWNIGVLLGSHRVLHEESEMAVFFNDAPPTIDDLADSSVIEILTYLDLSDIASPTFTQKRLNALSVNDEIWRLLCKARWRKFYRNEAWLKQAYEEEAARDEGSARTGLWKRQFKANEAKLTARHGMFFMTSHVRIGEVIGMHWFEPRYRWLASRLNNGTDETMVYCPGRPAVGAESFICVPRQLEIMPDGRAMVELLPVAKCVLNELWEEPVPGEPRAPKLVCVSTKELPLEGQGAPRGGLRFRGRSQSDGNAASSAEGGGGGGQDEAIAELLGGDNSAMTRFNGSATQLRIALLEILFAHGEANGIENVADLMEGERAAPRRLLELLSVLNDVSGGEDEDEEDEEDEFEDVDEGDDDEGGDGDGNEASAEASDP